MNYQSLTSGAPARVSVNQLAAALHREEALRGPSWREDWAERSQGECCEREVPDQSTEVKPAHPQHALKLKAGCGFGFGGLGLDRPGLCL